MDSEGNLTILDRVKIASDFHRLMASQQERRQVPENGTSEADQPTLRFRPLNDKRLRARFQEIEPTLKALDKAGRPSPDLMHKRITI